MDIQRTIFDIIEEEGTIFKNREVFSLEYIPEIYKFRNPQLNKMAFYSRKLYKNKAPSNMLLRGTNASGKTSTLKKYFKIINEHFENTLTIYINCQIYRTEYEIFSKIYKLIFNKPIARLSSTDFHDEIMEYLIENDITLIIALDDYGVIKNTIELNRTLYSLLRAHETYSGVKISLIVITSKEENIYLNLNVSTMLLPIEINFPQYTKTEIYSILKQRTELGFYPNVLKNEDLVKITNKTYKKANLRYGIKQLELLGEKAEFNGDKEIIL